MSTCDSKKLAILENKTQIQENRIDELNDTFKEVKSRECSNDELVALKLRKQFLIERLNLEESFRKTFSVNIISHLREFFKIAIISAFPFLHVDNVDPTITKCNENGKTSLDGDYQCNSAFSLCKNPQISSIIQGKVSPLIIASKIVEFVPKSFITGKINVSGPGYINISLSKESIETFVQDIVKFGARPSKLEKKCQVVVDMSSPNIAKEMHVGHLRSTIIGDSIAIFLKFLGHNVKKVNHIGDWGTQFGMLIAHLKDTFPNYKKEMPNISDIMILYKESKQRFDNDENFKQESKLQVVKLQSGDADNLEIWERICHLSRIEFEKIYKRLNILDLIEMGESFYNKLMPQVVQDLKDCKLAVMEDERIIANCPGSSSTLTIVKSDGGFTYDTSDMACIKYRIQEMKANYIIYVVDSGQSSHLKSIVALAKAAGYNDGSIVCKHVDFGVVCGIDNKRLKTRSGDTVKLVDLLNEGVERASEKLSQKAISKVLGKEEFGNICSCLAYGCIKYADLSQRRTNDYVFSYDRMLDDKGNTALYLLYAYTRICSIIKNTDYSTCDIENLNETLKLSIDEGIELKLSKTLVRFAEVMNKVAENFMFHILCDYLYELATIFTAFYDKCYITEKVNGIVKLNKNRLIIVYATLKIMKSCFDILNIKTIERM